MIEVRYVKYLCPSCEAVDTDKLFENEQPAPAINCWSCGAGRNKNMAEMIHTRMGMFPVVEESAAA